METTSHNSPFDRSPEDSRIGRFELAAVLAITLIGFGLRVAFPSRAAVEHFDEGVYATRLWFAEGEDPPYPDRHLYAPPLVPWMVRWSVDLFGSGLWGAMLPAVVFGTLTIPLVWWTARRWFGGAAGLAGAVLAAGSDFHVLYSRTALTDVPLCFWLLASVYCVWESFRAGSFRWAIGAGIAAGLAWWTKYNGWLAVAIAGAGVVPWLLGLWKGTRQKAVGRSSTPSEHAARAMDSVVAGPSGEAAGVSAVRARTADGVELRPTGPRAWRVAGCWIVLAAVACAVWSPVLVGLQEHGGYGVVASNHQKYIVGIEAWWPSLLQQAANHRLLDGMLSWAGVFLAGAMPLIWRVAGRRELTLAACAGTLLTAGLACLLAAGYETAVVLAMAAVGGIGAQLLAGRPEPPPALRGRMLAAWLIAAWFCGLLLTTPLYRAYPRLTLPWLLAAWLGAGAAVQRLATAGWWNASASVRAQRLPVVALCLLVLGWGLPVTLTHWQRITTARAIGWQDRTAVERIAESIIDLAARVSADRGFDSTAPIPFVVYVYAEPAIVFHLTERGIVAQPASSLDFIQKAAAQPQVPTFFVAGPHAWRTPEFTEAWQRHASRFELWYDARYTPSGLVLLNLHDPRRVDVSGHPAWPDSDRSHSMAEPVRVYLVR